MNNIMVIYSGNVLEDHRQRFVDDLVDKNIEFHRVAEGYNVSLFYFVYFDNEEDELAFKLTWPNFTKDV